MSEPNAGVSRPPAWCVSEWGGYTAQACENKSHTHTKKHKNRLPTAPAIMGWGMEVHLSSAIHPLPPTLASLHFAERRGHGLSEYIL